MLVVILSSISISISLSRSLMRYEMNGNNDLLMTFAYSPHCHCMMRIIIWNLLFSEMKSSSSSFEWKKNIQQMKNLMQRLFLFLLYAILLSVCVSTTTKTTKNNITTFHSFFLFSFRFSPLYSFFLLCLCFSSSLSRSIQVALCLLSTLFHVLFYAVRLFLYFFLPI